MKKLILSLNYNWMGLKLEKWFILGNIEYTLNLF